MDKVAVSRAVATLLSAGRLRRTMAKSDRRRTHLELTPAGKRVYARVVPMALNYERHLIAPLSAREQAAWRGVSVEILARIWLDLRNPAHP